MGQPMGQPMWQPMGQPMDSTTPPLARGRLLRLGRPEHLRPDAYRRTRHVICTHVIYANVSPAPLLRLPSSRLRVPQPLLALHSVAQSPTTLHRSRKGAGTIGPDHATKFQQPKLDSICELGRI